MFPWSSPNQTVA